MLLYIRALHASQDCLCLSSGVSGCCKLYALSLTAAAVVACLCRGWGNRAHWCYRQHWTRSNRCGNSCSLLVSCWPPCLVKLLLCYNSGHTKSRWVALQVPQGCRALKVGLCLTHVKLGSTKL